MKKRNKNIVNILSVLVIVLSVAFVIIHFSSSKSTPKDNGVTGTTASQSDKAGTEEATAPGSTADTTAGTSAAPATEAATVAPPPVTTEKYDGEARYAAFTFDDGPNATITNEVLKVLKENNARATFFILGQNAKTYPNIVKNIVDAGCEVGTHSYSHKNYSKLSADEIKSDLSSSIKAIEEVSGTTVRLFRAPYGAYNNTVKESVNRPIILWSYDTRDWAYKIKKNDSRSAAQIEADKKSIENKLLNFIRDGEIVLMHDMNKMTLDVCKDVIPKLVKDGWKIVSVSELAAMRGKELTNGTVYSRPIVEQKTN
ncbi:MAG: polysaccharide deacetylase family protein [Clostridiales bacterium]|nr:polysaccharide deacetylase family protein [Clostridiales bacterium]